MTPFSDVWDDVKSFLSENKVVRVCGVGDFSVVAYSDVGVSVMSQDSLEPELVKKEWFMDVWAQLSEKRTLCPDDLLGDSGARMWSSFILSVFSYQPYVGYLWDGGRNCYALRER
jgi:hypothetical protein